MKKENARKRDYCFTAYKYPKPDIDKISYMVYQRELCPSTGREHWQGFAQLREASSRRTFQRIMGIDGLNCRTIDGTPEQNREYCTKLKSRASEDDPYFEHGEIINQGHRSDMDIIYTDIEEGKTMKELLKKHEGKVVRCIHAVEKAMKCHWDLFPLDDYIKLQRKKNKDKLDEKIEDELYKQLYK